MIEFPGHLHDYQRELQDYDVTLCTLTMFPRNPLNCACSQRHFTKPFSIGISWWIHISDRIILLGKSDFTFLSVYAPQVDRIGPEKERFADQLQCAVVKVPATEILIPVGNCNDHIGASAGVCSNGHGGHCFGIHNTEDERIVKFAIADGLHVGVARFKKSDAHLITYSSGGDSTQIDYILWPKSFRSAISNVKCHP